MNHLAHLFLSRHSDKMMVGNFIADGVKGKKYLDFKEDISRGIIMHRHIDSFTDTNPVVSHSKSFFRERYGLFSGVLVDLFYDHFLAKNFSSYSDTPLSVFADECYRVFEKYLNVMPERYRLMFPYMQKENWLLNYKNIEGIQHSLNGMGRRIKNHPGIEKATEELKSYYEELENDFKKYFPLLIEHVHPFTG
jgi:acyl carrier protein phosphodiesterase